MNHLSLPKIPSQQKSTAQEVQHTHFLLFPLNRKVMLFYRPLRCSVSGDTGGMRKP
jgi:hypothetical protein